MIHHLRLKISEKVRDDRGRAIAAVSIAGPPSRINSETYDYYGGMVIEACRRISRDLGYRLAVDLEASSAGIESSWFVGGCVPPRLSSGVDGVQV